MSNSHKKKIRGEGSIVTRKRSEERERERERRERTGDLLASRAADETMLRGHGLR